MALFVNSFDPYIIIRERPNYQTRYCHIETEANSLSGERFHMNQENIKLRESYDFIIVDGKKKICGG